MMVLADVHVEGCCGLWAVGCGTMLNAWPQYGRGMGPGLVPYAPIPFLNPPPVHWWQQFSSGHSAALAAGACNAMSHHPGAAAVWLSFPADQLL
jgi:hypothetical protein